MSPIISSLTSNWTTSGGGGGLDLPGNPDELFYVGSSRIAKVNSGLTALSNNWTSSTNGVAMWSASTSFPASMADVIISPDGTAWGYAIKSSQMRAFKLSDGTLGTTMNTSGGSNNRGCCTTRNNFACVFTGSDVRSYSINNDGSFNHIATSSHANNSVENAISPPYVSSSSRLDKSNLGTTGDSSGNARLVFHDKGSSGRLKSLVVSSSGQFSNARTSSVMYQEATFLAYYPNGHVIAAGQDQQADFRLRVLTGEVDTNPATTGGVWTNMNGPKVQSFNPTPYGTYVLAIRKNAITTTQLLYETYRYNAGSNRLMPLYSSQDTSGSSSFNYPNDIVYSQGYVWWNGYDDDGKIRGRPHNPASGTNWSGTLKQLGHPSENMGMGMAILTGRPKWAERDEILNQW
jgi:hypothetical protein|tara:strand:- start:233 stop:1444 length:1212 start_codon:yes stop_codon:yes gene_type:complete